MATASPGVYDSARRRASVRRGRERGCWLYIPAVELDAAGVDPSEAPPFYRIWPGGGRKRRLMIQLYLEP